MTVRRLSFLLAGAVLLAYLPIIPNGFVWDDKQYILDNVNVTGGATLENLRWALSSFRGGNWHPLTWFSHMLDVELFGLKPWGHHLTNIALHLANTVLLFALLKGLTGTIWRSFFVAATFGLHPLRVESVAWAAERKDLLSGFFFMLVVAAHTRYVRRPSGLRFLVVPLLFALGLTSKPMLVTLPFVLLLLDWWPLGRLTLSSAPRRLLEATPMFALAGGSAVITFLAQKQSGYVAPLDQLTFPLRVGNAAVSYLRYLAKTGWPADLAAFYPHPGHLLTLPAAVAAGTALILATAGALTIARRLPFITVGWLWFLGMLVPVIGVLQVGSQGLADRYTYLPQIGILVAVTWAAEAACRQSPVTRHSAAVVGTVVLALFGTLTSVQLGHWRDNTTLFTHATQVTRRNWLAEANLGYAELARGRFQEAAAHFRTALTHRGDVAEVHFNLGLAQTGLGQGSAAQGSFARALTLRPRFPEAEKNLGAVLANEGRLGEAEAHYRRALELRPDYVRAQEGLREVLKAQQRH